jgi:hypothetical protein
MARNIRLRDTAKRRVRVRDLAKELDVETAAVMAFLKDSGEFVRSSASNIEEPVARGVRAFFAGPLEARAHDPRPNPVTPQTAAVSHGLSAPTQRDRRENNPYASPQERPRDRWVLGVPRKVNEARSDKGERYMSETSDPGADDYSAAVAYRPSTTMKDWEWKVRDICETERDVWLSMASDQTKPASLLNASKPEYSLLISRQISTGTRSCSASLMVSRPMG